MTKKGKMLMAIASIAIVLAGVVGVYLNGESLMGKVSFTKDSGICGDKALLLYSTSELDVGKYSSFDAFKNALKKEISSNRKGRLLNCMLSVRAGGENYLIINGNYKIGISETIEFMEWGIDTPNVIGLGPDQKQSVLSLHSEYVHLFLDNLFVKESTEDILVFRVMN